MDSGYHGTATLLYKLDVHLETTEKLQQIAKIT